MKDIFDKWITSIDWKWGNFSMLPIFFGTILACLDITMMGTVKMVSQGSIAATPSLAFSMGSYAIVPLIFLKAMNYEGMVATNLVWNLMSNVIVTLQGVFIFGESIKGLRWLGIAMSFFALVLLAYTND